MTNTRIVNWGISIQQEPMFVLIVVTLKIGTELPANLNCWLIRPARLRKLNEPRIPRA
jgi:hypothetical protein